MFDVPTVPVSSLPDPLPEGMLVLDVREDVEWRHGRIDGAVHVPVHDIPHRSHELPGDVRLLVICKIGGRSLQAVRWLRAHDHDAINLDGGMLEWVDAGRPIVADEGVEPHVV